MSLFAFLVAYQFEKPTATVKLEAAKAVVGKPLRGTLTLTLPEGQHGYQNPPTDEYENPIKLSVVGTGFKLGKVEYPKGIDLQIAGAAKPSKVYEGTVTIPFTLVSMKASNVSGVSFRVDYQLCTMSSCYPPTSLVVKVPLNVSVASKAKKA